MPSQVAAAKAPEVTAAFWVVKIITTGLGETTSDFLVRQFDPMIIIPIAGIALVAALAWQVLIPGFSKWRYWLAVVLVAVVGTMAADALHVILAVPYAVSTAAFALGLVTLFVTWHAREGTLSIHSITARSREIFYWAAIILTFALGTAAGDLTATNFGLGYLGAGLVFLLLFAVPLLGGQLANWNEVGTFWVAYVLTRPLGASFADWVGVGHARGGLELGTGIVSVLLACAGAAIVASRPFPAAKPEELSQIPSQPDHPW